MSRITEKDIEGLQPKRRDDGSLADGYVWDSELTGFSVKATAGGKKVFLVQYRIGGRAGKTQRVTLGVWGRMTLSQARKLAKETLGRVAARGDPAEEIRQAKRAQRLKAAAGTLREVMESFLALHAKESRYWREKRARLVGDDLKALHNVLVRDVKRAAIAGVIDDVKVRSQAAARLLFADLRPVFKWALDRGLLEVNPMAAMKGPKPVELREHVLEPHEVKTLWQATGDMAWPFSSIYRLLLLTGTRREEVAGMRWNELDLDSSLWLIPGSRTKNGRPHKSR